MIRRLRREYPGQQIGWSRKNSLGASPRRTPDQVRGRRRGPEHFKI